MVYSLNEKMLMLTWLLLLFGYSDSMLTKRPVADLKVKSKNPKDLSMIAWIWHCLVIQAFKGQEGYWRTAKKLSPNTLENPLLLESAGNGQVTFKEICSEL